MSSKVGKIDITQTEQKGRVITAAIDSFMHNQTAQISTLPKVKNTYATTYTLPSTHTPLQTIQNLPTTDPLIQSIRYNLANASDSLAIPTLSHAFSPFTIVDPLLNTRHTSP